MPRWTLPISSINSALIVEPFEASHPPQRGDGEQWNDPLANSPGTVASIQPEDGPGKGAPVRGLLQSHPRPLRPSRRRGRLPFAGFVESPFFR